MSDRGAELLAAVLADPSADPPRLVYADYLMEKGDPRGELISVQVQLTQKITPARRARARRRERELLAAHRSAIIAASAPFASPYSIKIRRGFIDQLYSDGAAFVEGGAELMAREPVRKLALRLDFDQLETILERGLLAQVSELSLSGSIGDAGVRALAASEKLGAIRRLRLSYCDIGDEGLAALVASPNFGARSLALGSNDVGDAGAAALAAAPALANITNLYLPRNPIGDDGAAALAGSPHLQAMQILSLSSCEELGDAGALAFARSELASSMHRLELQVLDLGRETEETLRQVWGSKVWL